MYLPSYLQYYEAMSTFRVSNNKGVAVEMLELADIETILGIIFNNQ